MERIMYFYRLNEGVTMEAFWKWSLETDQPITSQQPGVLKFETYEVTAFTNAKYDVMELIEAESYEAWSAVGKLPAMKKVASEWPLYGDASSVIEVRLKKIE